MRSVLFSHCVHKTDTCFCFLKNAEGANIKFFEIADLCVLKAGMRVLTCVRAHGHLPQEPDQMSLLTAFLYQLQLTHTTVFFRLVPDAVRWAIIFPALPPLSEGVPSTYLSPESHICKREEVFQGVLRCRRLRREGNYCAACPVLPGWGCRMVPALLASCFGLEKPLPAKDQTIRTFLSGGHLERHQDETAESLLMKRWPLPAGARGFRRTEAGVTILQRAQVHRRKSVAGVTLVCRPVRAATRASPPRQAIPFLLCAGPCGYNQSRRVGGRGRRRCNVPVAGCPRHRPELGSFERKKRVTKNRTAECIRQRALRVLFQTTTV